MQRCNKPVILHNSYVNTKYKYSFSSQICLLPEYFYSWYCWYCCWNVKADWRKWNVRYGVILQEKWPTRQKVTHVSSHLARQSPSPASCGNTALTSPCSGMARTLTLTASLKVHPDTLTWDCFIAQLIHSHSVFRYIILKIKGRLRHTIH